VILAKGVSTKSIRLVGVDPHRQIRVTNIQSYMQHGSFLDLGSGGRRMLVGDGLLKKVGAKIGDILQITGGQGFATLPFKVIGSFHTGVISLDENMAFSALVDVQAVNQKPSQITDIALRLTDVNLAQEVAADYSVLHQDKVQSWDQSNANILSVFSLQNFIRMFISTAIMVVAAFGIYNILSILVAQKRKDIGILRSVGFDKNDIVRLFLIQGLILGLTGGLLGLLVGYLLSMYLSTLSIAGMTDKLMVSFSQKIYVSGLVMAVVASIISSILPARGAGKLEPIDIVRSGE
jgi:lipoprotein-releasing system permease protein